jgi:hypothetical protein
VNANAVVQKSTDHGKTWGPITRMQPGFPAGGGYDASVLVQPNGVVDALMIDHALNPRTFRVLKRWNGPGAPEHLALSWGSAVGDSHNSEIYATVVGR